MTKKRHTPCRNAKKIFKKYHKIPQKPLTNKVGGGVKFLYAHFHRQGGGNHRLSGFNYGVIDGKRCAGL